MANTFSASLLQSSGSHDPSEITLIYRFAAQETLIIIISNQQFLHIFFVETMNYFFQDSLNRK